MTRAAARGSRRALAVAALLLVAGARIDAQDHPMTLLGGATARAC